MTDIKVADASGDLLVFAAYYNSEHSASRRQNYEIFRESLRERGVPLLTVECAFSNHDFELSASPQVLRVRSSAVLWQKERLFNIALERAPAGYDKIAWIDADVLFENPQCFSETARLLEDYPVIQMFESVARLPRDQRVYSESCAVWRSFGARAQIAPRVRRRRRFRHGHTGFAWAARREVLTGCGFFDLCLSGGNDHLMAHACIGDWNSPCIDNLVGFQTPMHSEYLTWGSAFFSAVRGRLGFTPGRALHLWHGDDRYRSYRRWSEEFKACHPQPRLDIRLNDTGCWEWTGTNPALESWSSGLFSSRREDE